MQNSQIALMNLIKSESAKAKEGSNVVDHYDGEKGAKVTIDSSSGTSGADIKSGHLGDIDDLTLKSGEGTGMEDMNNLNGIASENVEEYSATQDSKTATKEEKKKAHDDVWKLNDMKVAAMDNTDWDNAGLVMLLI